MLGKHNFTDPRKQRFSPDSSDPHLLRRAAQSQHLHRPLTESDTFMPKLRPGLGRTQGVTSAYGSRQRLIGLTELKDSLTLPSKLKQQTIFHDKEQLLEETLSLKTENNQLKMINVRLGTKLSQLEQELLKKDQLLQQLSGLTEEKQFSSIVLETHLIANLKQSIRKLKFDLQQKDDAYEKLKKAMKMTKIAELEAEAQEYFAECQRLKEFIKDSGQIDTSKSRNLQFDGKLVRENQELTSALHNSRKDAVNLTERLQEMEEAAKISKAKEIRVRELIADIADCKERVKELESELQQRNIHEKDRIGMIAEEGNSKIGEVIRETQRKMREIEEFYRLQIDNLEIDKGDLIRSIRETSLRVIKRKVMKKRLSFPDLLPASTTFSLHDLKTALRSTGLKVHKWQISGLSVARETLGRDSLVQEYEQIPAPADLQSTVMPASSFNSDTFSLTSNPFEVADASKRSSGVNPTPSSLGAMEYSQSLKPALSHQSQPAPTLVPVEERDSETPITPTGGADSSPSYTPDPPNEALDEVLEDDPGEEAFRLGIYTNPGGDLMSIAEVRKSLSTDSLEYQQFEKPTSPGAVILLNIEEDRVRKTIQHIRLRLKAQKIPSSAVPDLLIPLQSCPFTNIDGLKSRLQSEPFAVRDEADALATAGYLFGHRTGLVDTQRQLAGTQVAVGEIGSWTVLSAADEESFRRSFEETLKRLSFDDFKGFDGELSGRVPLSALYAVCEGKGIELSDVLKQYVELQAYAETKEVGLFPYSRVLKPYHPAPAPTHLDSDSLAKECAEHIGTELLVQGLTINEAFDLQGEVSPAVFREKVRSLGLEDLEGVEEFVRAVTGAGGTVQPSEVVRYLGQFSLEEGQREEQD